MICSLFPQPSIRLCCALLAAALGLAACGGAGSAPLAAPSPPAGDQGGGQTGGGQTGGGGGGGGVPGAGPTYVVGNAPLPAGATRVSGLTDVPWQTLPAGSTVLLSPGTYSTPFMINANGTAAQPISVQAADNANPPVLTVSVDLQGAGYVQLSNLTVQSPVYSAVVIRRGSHHITVSDSVMRGAPAGINISDGAGTGNVILRNVIEDSTNDGIAIDRVNADPADPTLIQYNTVVRSGVHGMEITGSNYVIEHNDVSYSGQVMGGTSGIHLYRAGETDIAVAGNLIRYNYAYLNADTRASDGNGIEVDQYCDNNTVAFNVVWGNDGAGIIVYDGNGNRVYANAARDNNRDPAHTHGGFGELIVDSSGIAGRPANNTVYDNLLVSTRASVPAVWIDTLAVAAGSNRVGPNLMFNTAGGASLRWTNSAQYSDATRIDSITGTNGNLVAAPAFVDVSQSRADGLRLTAFPGGIGTPLSGQTDLLGQPYAAGWSSFGAYFTSP